MEAPAASSSSQPPTMGKKLSTLPLSELKSLKRQLFQEIADIERQIHRDEGAYLEEALGTNLGNVVRGWDLYLQRGRTSQPPTKKRTLVKESDRLFSMSSGTYKASVYGAAATTVSP
eukprot:TRINITY_DN116225_c0_g1_i1.p2 TRINITY_DN116225_c0_g1~~TRINITY_DN116225_c0_g1_i1.p2  ORF type:complete len:117 (+),score=3.06 TRINITY_DN116225_c0_g1_i1:27-377(+)